MGSHALRNCALIVAALFASTSMAATFGRTPGQFNVSTFGSAQYTIPIWAPPGPRNIQPSISLSYDSQSGAGPLGVGWSLAGLGAITRCNQTSAQDGASANVTLTLSDVFCINGKRMRLIGGTSYGADGTTYATEIADFSLITANGTAGNGPASFTVKARNGLIYQYGLTDANGHGANSQVLATGSTTVLTWLLSRVSDRSGNNYVINYLTPTGATPTPPTPALTGTSAPDTILWTPTSSGASTYSYTMKFNYASGGNVPQGTQYSYVAGTVIVDAELLTSIEVEAGGTVLKDYILGYQGSPETSRNQLKSITECADVAQTTCLLPTNITYPTVAPGTSTSSLSAVSNVGVGVLSARYDLNGDGIPDIVYSDGTYYQAALSTPTGYQVHPTGIPVSAGAPLMGNLTGGPEDGMLANISNEWEYFLWDVPSGTFVSSDAHVGFVSGSITYKLADVNGDGLPDLVRQWNQITTHPGQPSTVIANLSVRLNTGFAGGPAKFSTTETVWYTSPSDTLTGVNLLGLESQRGKLRRLDFNGDGKDDLAIEELTGVSPNEIILEVELISTGSSFTTGASILHARQADLGVTYFLNWNDDKCTDFVSAGTLYLSACNGNAAISVATGIGTVLGAMDWDGDGRTDLLVSDGGSTLGVLLSTGSGASGIQNTGIPLGACSFFTVDANGDGLDDVGCDSGSGSSHTFTYYPHNSTPDLAITFTDGYGVNYSPSYVALSASGGIYTRGTSAVAPYRDYSGSLNVVSSYSGSDGIGGTYTNGFKYAGAVVNIAGRGLQGFTTISRRDGRTQFLDTKTYSTVFPNSGMVTAESIVQFDGTNVANASYTLATLTINPSSTEPQVFPYITTSNTNKYEAQPASSNGGTAGSYNGQLITTIAKNFGTPDSAGNFTSVSTTATDEDPNSLWPGLQWVTQTVATVAADFSAGNWCLTLPTEVDVTNTPPSSLGAPAKTRHVSYVSPDYVHCRQTEQVIEPSSTKYKLDTVYTYGDSFGNVTSQTVSGSGITSRTSGVTYGTTGQFPVSAKNALLQTSLINIDPNSGQPLSITDPNNIQTSWHYDTFQRKDLETRPDGTATSIGYNDCATAGCVNSNNRTTVVQTNKNADGTTLNIQNIYLDQFDRTLVNSKQMLNGAFDRNEVQYDSVGNVEQFAAPCTFLSCTASWTVNEYDPLNRLVKTQRPISGEHPTVIAYTGRKTVTTDRLLKSTTTYKKLTGPLGRTVDANGYYVNFHQDAFGAELSVTDSLSNTLKTMTYGYGAKAFLESLSDMDLGSRSYTHDALGELTAYSDGKSQSFSTSYDPLSRPLQRTEPDLTTIWTWGNTASKFNIGMLDTVTSGTGANAYSESYSYDSKGRLTERKFTLPSDSIATRSFDYIYNATTGLLDTLQYPAGYPSGFRVQTQYTYQHGILSKIANATDATAILWEASATNAWGEITQEDTGQASGNPREITSRSYDPVTGLLGAVVSGSNGGSARQNESYLYDAMGDLTQRQDNNEGLTENLYYDNVYRLDHSTLTTASTSTTVTNLQMHYDAMGDITSRSDVAAGATWTYDPTRKHAVTSAGGAVSYNYDADGNVSSRNGSIVSWTSYNYPSGLSVGAEMATFDYGPDRQRWRMNYSNGGSSEKTLYASPMFEAVTTSAGTEYRYYVYAANRPVVLISRSTTGSVFVRSLLTNHQDSISAIVDNSSGALIAGESFTPYGLRREASTWSGTPTSGELSTMNGVTREGYTFQTVLGSMGLNHMNGRIEDAVTGRFLSADPHGIHRGSTQSFNRYSYVGNNPVTFVDPSGFETDCDDCDGGGGGGGGDSDAGPTNDPVSAAPKKPSFTGSNLNNGYNGISEASCIGDCGVFAGSSSGVNAPIPGVGEGTSPAGSGATSSSAPASGANGETDAPQSQALGGQTASNGLEEIVVTGAPPAPPFGTPTPPDNIPGGPWQWSPNPQNPRGGNFMGPKPPKGPRGTITYSPPTDDQVGYWKTNDPDGSAERYFDDGTPMVGDQKQWPSGPSVPPLTPWALFFWLLTHSDPAY